MNKNGVSNPAVAAKFTTQANQFITHLQASYDGINLAPTRKAKAQVMAGMAEQRFREMNFSNAGDTSALGVSQASGCRARSNKRGLSSPGAQCNPMPLRLAALGGSRREQMAQTPA
jgi:hypothetical protein